MLDQGPAAIEANLTVLREARARAGLSIERAAELASKVAAREGAGPINAQRLRSWEAGETQPTIVQAEVLTQIYFIPFVSLFQPELPSKRVTDFRRGSEGQSEPLSYETLKRLHTFEAKLYSLAKRLATELGIIEDIHIPKINLNTIESADSLEDIASQVRQLLGVSQETQLLWNDEESALMAWRDSVEAKGVFVFSLSMEVTECRGASLWEDAGPAAILLNTADDKTAQQFTLMHELAHLIFTERKRGLTLCDPASSHAPSEERFANRFAAAVLLPRSLVERVLPRRLPTGAFADWAPRERRRLRRDLKVSQEAIGIRIQELDIAPYGGKRSFWVQSPLHRTRSRPVWERYRRYLGSRTVQLGREVLNSEAMSIGELCRILDIKAKDVEKAIG
jgi:Zn-dependent peptidase ImmA (M78 family)